MGHSLIDAEALRSLVGQYTRPDGTVNSTLLAKALGEPRTTVQAALARLAPSTSQFQLDPGETITGRSILAQPDGAISAQWIKTRKAGEQTELTREAIEEMFAEYRGAAKLAPCKDTPLFDNLLTLYPTADVHLGLLAWGRETGEPWDLDIASNAFLKATNALIDCAPPSYCAIILDLGDWLHANDQKNATPASGHQLDVDGRFPKVAKAGVKLRLKQIELAAQKHEKVIYRGLPGNHDPEAQQWLSIALSIFFENNPRIVIDDDPSDFWFFKHGEVMLAANHGHKCKPVELPGIMASRRPEMWGSTKWRHAFSGHVHHERSGEKHGARWETLRTMTPLDAYGHQHGFGAGRELTSITYSATRGPHMRQFMPVS